MRKKTCLIVILLLFPGCRTTDLGIEDAPPGFQVQRLASPIPQQKGPKQYAKCWLHVPMFSLFIKENERPAQISSNKHGLWFNEGFAEGELQVLDQPEVSLLLLPGSIRIDDTRKLSAYGALGKKLKRDHGRSEIGLAYIRQSSSKRWQAIFRAGFAQHRNHSDQFRAFSSHVGITHFRKPDAWFSLVDLQGGAYIGRYETQHESFRVVESADTIPPGKRENQGHNPGGNFDHRDGERGNPHQRDEDGRIDHGDTASDGHDHRRIPQKVTTQIREPFFYKMHHDRSDFYGRIRVNLKRFKFRNVLITPIVAASCAYSTRDHVFNWQTGIGIELGDGQYRFMFARDWRNKRCYLTFSIRINFFKR